MKNSAIIILLLCIFFFTTNTPAQITITNGDIENVFAVRNRTTIHSESSQSAVYPASTHIVMTFPVQILQHIVLVQFNAVA